MLAAFCLRLACGLAGALLVLNPRLVNPRFYRVQFLTVLGLAAAAVALRGTAAPLAWAWAAALVLAFLGSVAWSLEGAPGGRALAVLTTAVLAGALLGTAPDDRPAGAAGAGGSVAGAVLPGADQLTSAALLGTATTAMLLGHSYLVFPTMSLAPLVRLLYGLFAATALRLAVAGLGLWSWCELHSLTDLGEETVLLLPVRWLVGFLFPLVFGGMALASARIRSTQSATGILYVVVIFCFLGELTSQVLHRQTGYVL